MSMSNEDLLKELSSKSIMEVVELVKMLEEEWGVSAAAPVAAVPGRASSAVKAEQHLGVAGQAIDRPVSAPERGGLHSRDTDAKQPTTEHRMRPSTTGSQRQQPTTPGSVGIPSSKDGTPNAVVHGLIFHASDVAVKPIVSNKRSDRQQALCRATCQLQSSVTGPPCK